MYPEGQEQILPPITGRRTEDCTVSVQCPLFKQHGPPNSKHFNQSIWS